MASGHSVTAELSSSEFERQFFAGAKQVRVTVDLLEETYRQAVSLIEQSGMEEAEGWRAIIGAGVAFLKGERALQAHEGTDKLRAEEVERLLKRLTEVESMYAVLKFRTFGFMRGNQAMELHTSALRATVAGLEQTVDRLRAENESLKGELAVTRARVAQTLPSQVAPQPPPLPKGWRTRLAAWLLSGQQGAPK